VSSDFKITDDDLAPFGSGLARPECVVATRQGDLFVSDRDHAVTRLSATGVASKLAANIPPDFMCNGFSLLPGRDCLIANLGNSGGVWRLRPDGTLSPEVMDVDGVAVPPVNFVNAIEHDGNTTLWVSVSTTRVPREQSFRRDVADGFIFKVDSRGCRVVADGLGFTNENKLNAAGDWLYVNETIARRMSRFRVLDNGDLGPRETVVEFGEGIWPDGFEFDSEGGIWVASVVSNRLLRLDADLNVSTVIDDSDPQAVAQAEASFSADTFGREHIDAGKAGRLGNLASVNFGGADLKTVYLGSLFNDHLLTFRSPVAGALPHHFEY